MSFCPHTGRRAAMPSQLCRPFILGRRAWCAFPLRPLKTSPDWEMNAASFFFFFSSTGMELRASHMPGTHSTTEPGTFKMPLLGTQDKSSPLLKEHLCQIHIFGLIGIFQWESDMATETGATGAEPWGSNPILLHLLSSCPQG